MGLCRISSSGSGGLNSGGLLAGFVRTALVVSSPERMWLPPMPALLKRAPPTQPKPVRVLPSSQHCRPVCDVDATSCFMNCGSCLPRRNRVIQWHSANMANRSRSLFLGINPPLPWRILGNNKKSFHARVLDGSVLVSDRASCIASRTAPWYAPTEMLEFLHDQQCGECSGYCAAPPHDRDPQLLPLWTQPVMECLLPPFQHRLHLVPLVPGGPSPACFPLSRCLNPLPRLGPLVGRRPPSVRGVNLFCTATGEGAFLIGSTQTTSSLG